MTPADDETWAAREAFKTWFGENFDTRYDARKTAHTDVRAAFMAGWLQRSQVDGHDECVSCGGMFNATVSDKLPICRRCK